MEPYVKSEVHRHINTIEFFHPQSNSLPGKILNELASKITHAGEDPETKVIILRSAGDRAFCAGASFNELAAIKTEKEGLEFFSGFATSLLSAAYMAAVWVAELALQQQLTMP
jgi:methylglutaconyl-CoA hydratase